jgi:hypothetical protein
MKGHSSALAVTDSHTCFSSYVARKVTTLVGDVYCSSKSRPKSGGAEGRECCSPVVTCPREQCYVVCAS